MGYLAWGSGYARLHDGRQYGWVTNAIPQDAVKSEFRRLAAKYDAQAQAERSCEIARKMDGMLDESLAGFTAGRSVNAATVDQQLPNVRTYKTRTQSMIQAYCR